jgi:hypothetical protein
LFELERSFGSAYIGVCREAVVQRGGVAIEGGGLIPVLADSFGVNLIATDISGEAEVFVRKGNKKD